MLAFLAGNVTAEELPLNMTKGVTAISEQVYGLHMTIFWICCVIGLAVFGVMFWSIYHHRKSKGAVPAQFHENTKVEIVWTAIPFFILVGMAIPATLTLMAMEDTSKADVSIQVTGSQWKWHYKYLDSGVEFYSLMATPKSEIANKRQKGKNYLLEVDRPLVIPTNKKVRFLITSDDVIHSWWVPDFAVKKDANPGFINEAWTEVNEPGIYRGQCAELCGKDHGFMPVVVIAKAPAEYEKWLNETKLVQQKAKEEEQKLLAMNMSQDELMAVGEKVYNTSCAACHQPNGQGIPGVFPGIKNSPIATGELDAHIDIVVNGKGGTAMQAFGKQLSLKELAGVITYQRNAWGNDMGDSVQAAQVYKLLSGQQE
ncbi:cytochrome c oxidase subunit II [Flocculibacter collagenilyticus]|uniref:cytochrome c oxidase subunit II n=1 Tax=Flocculibacter collagenilyticus TaxID=2744479 RepID=UPI0018F44696|nr:cytochrome c oxidase subunit II [Flocculibacter collagenilyticus]